MSWYNLYRYITVTKVANVDLCQVHTTGVKPQFFTQRSQTQAPDHTPAPVKTQSQSLDDYQKIPSRLNVCLCWDQSVNHWE